MPEITYGRWSPTEVMERVLDGTWVAATLPLIYSTEVLADSPELYWKLNDTNSTAIDSSGNNRNGTIYNATSTTGYSAELGTAHSFNASNTYVQGTFSTNYTTALTLEVVIKPGTQTDLSGTIWSKNTFYADSYVNFPASISISTSNVLSFSLSTGNDYTAENTFTYTVTPNNWYHVVGVYQQNGTSGLYVNGSLVDSATTNYALSSSSNNWTLGRHATEYSSGTGQNNYVGLIQHAALYSTSLSGSRIQAHYQAITD